ncbi:MAG: DUF2666 family protein [Candidatus Diapherotrites archaeon]
MAEEKYIQFVANYDDWVAIRKLKIEPATDPRTVMEFLAGLTNSVDSKVEENLRKIVDLKKVDDAIASLGLGKKDVAKALEEINSRKVSSAIKEICALPELQSAEQKELEQFCRIYATKKALKECGLMVDYSNIEIPGMKKLKKTKV